MKITEIRQQVRRQDRYSTHLDGKYVFSLAEHELKQMGLKVEQEISRAELENLKQQSEFGKALDRSFRFLSIRPRSEHEMREYLRRKNYGIELIEDLLKELHDMNYLDDRKFAKSWVHDRRLLKPISRRRLALELKSKRVADDIISEVLDEDETDELAVIKDVIARKRRQTQYQDPQKLKAYLFRQGYPYDLITQALQETENS